MNAFPGPARAPGPMLVTGGSGQLALAIERAAPRHQPVRRVGRPHFDFDQPASLAATLAAVQPALVVNAAAWTAVDLAETNPAAAGRANAEGPAELARLCALGGIPLLHVSTDYVFDGTKGAAYTETDPTSPTGIYGATKLAGERAVLAANPRTVVLRTSWLHSADGHNFVRTMLAAGRTRPSLRVVSDQRGCPTSADDLAEAILAVAARIAGGWRDEWHGIYHAAGAGSTTWHGLALAAFEEAGRYGRTAPAVEPIPTTDYPTPARRPADSRLDCERLATVFGVRLPPWRRGVARTVDTLLARESSAA